VIVQRRCASFLYTRNSTKKFGNFIKYNVSRFYLKREQSIKKTKKKTVNVQDFIYCQVNLSNKCPVG
jgi:hypothetical protein